MGSSGPNNKKRWRLGVDQNPAIQSSRPPVQPLLFLLAPFQMRFFLREAFLVLLTSSGIYINILFVPFLHVFFNKNFPSPYFTFCFFSAIVWNGLDLRGRLLDSLFFRIFFCFPWSIAISHSSGFRISAHSSRASFRVDSICCSKLCLSSPQSKTIV